jgi:hypothetical protein
MAPGFPNHARQAKRAKLVGDFTATAAIVVAAVNMEDILPWQWPGTLGCT